jgi:hypothetical protein
VQGPEGKQGEPGPSDLFVVKRWSYRIFASSPNDWPAEFTDQTVASLDVPAGSYSLTVKHDAMTQNTGCEVLLADGTSIPLHVEGTNPMGSAEETYGKSYTGEFESAAPTTVRLVCYGGEERLDITRNRTLSVPNVVMQALRVGQVSETVLPDVNEVHKLG